MQWWESKETREVLLVIITALVVAQVEHGLVHHWKSWVTWADFFGLWFIDAIGVGVFTVIALAAIIFTHKFFLGKEMPDIQGITIYIVLTVLVGALCIWVIAINWSPSDDDDFDEGSAAPYHLIAVT
jgi:uncharacterized membrane protein